MRRYLQSWKRPKVFEDIERLEDGINEETGEKRPKADQRGAFEKKLLLKEVVV